MGKLERWNFFSSIEVEHKIGEIKHYLKLVKNDPVLLWHFIVGWTRWFIHGRAIRQYNNKVRMCTSLGRPCYENNSCESCGCTFNALALSNKKCKTNVEIKDI